MDVLGDEDVAGYAEVLLFAGLFEDLLEGVFCFFCVKEGLALVTTEGDEVELVGLLEAFQARWHGGASSLHPTLRKGAKGWGTRAIARRIFQSPRRTAGDEVELVGLLEAFQARWHGGANSLHPTLREGAKDGAPGRSLPDSQEASRSACC